jgi:hypothetical protein
VLKARYEELFNAVHAQTLGQVAHEFDQVHSVERAQSVGSVHRIIPAADLRPYVIDALERGYARAGQHA